MDYLDVYSRRGIFSIKICWNMFSMDIFPIQSSYSEQKGKSFRKQSVLERITDFTERSSCSQFSYGEFFSSLKSTSIQTATHKSCFHFLVPAYWMLFCTCQPWPSVVSLLFIKGTNATCKDLPLHCKKKGWHFHTTVMELLGMPLCFDHFPYRLWWILSLG